MTPFFQILQGDTDITARVPQGRIGLNITDGVGSGADTFDFEIDDADGIIAPPKTGVDVRIIGGYRERAPRDFGRFTTDFVKLSGWPQTIAVNGQSNAAKTTTKQPRSQSYKTAQVPTYGDLISTLAERNGFVSTVDAAIANKALDYEAQTEENDLAFLERLGNRIGFDLTIKDKRLVVTKRGYGRSASGLLLPIIEVAYGRNIIDYSVERIDRPRYSTVRATWFDREETKTKEVDVPSSDEGPEFLIRTPFRSEEEALDAARSKAEDLRRGTATAEFTIDGNEQARAEAFVEVSGIRSLVDGRWRATNVTHAFSAGGPYTTTISCELPGAGADE